MKKILIILLAIIWIVLITEIPASYSQEADNKSDPRISRKVKEIKRLATDGAKHFLNNSIEISCYDFINKARWRKGDIFPFVFREDGIVLVYGDDTKLIWKDISGLKSIGGLSLIKEMLSQKYNNGYMSFTWNHGYQYAYIQIVEKKGIKYIVGFGFYPTSKAFLCRQIVEKAVSYFYMQGKDITFDLINDQNGPFISGDIYSFASDIKGNLLALGESNASFTLHLGNLVDSRGIPVVKEYIKVIRAKGKGWANYSWKGEHKRTYVQKVVDPKTKKSYVIGAGYFPTITLNVVKSLVNKAIRYLITNGTTRAFSEFNNQVGEFAKGPLRVFVFDLEGKCLANGVNPLFAGQNLLAQVDQDGKPIVKEFIKLGQTKGKGTLEFKLKNAFTVAYIEYIDIPEGKFIIGSQYYPWSKTQSVAALINRAKNALKTMPTPKAFNLFTDPKSKFFQGDLHVFAYNTKGTCFVNGDRSSYIWRNYMNAVDQEGNEIIQNIIAAAADGGGWTEYRMLNDMRRVYSKLVRVESKSGEAATYVIGSGYFL